MSLRSGCAAIEGTSRSFRLDSGHTVSGMRVPHQLRDERGVVQAGIAMVHALHLQQLDRLAHIGGRAFLARVRHHLEAALAAAAKELGELRGRVAHLRAAEAEAQQPAVPGAHVFEQGERLVLAAVALHDHDQARADAVFGMRAASIAPSTPSITAASGTPRLVWPCTPRNISACSTRSACARRR
jgi:hypothetical protein